MFQQSFISYCFKEWNNLKVNFLIAGWTVNMKWKTESSTESFHLTISTYFCHQNLNTKHKQTWMAEEKETFSRKFLVILFFWENEYILKKGRSIRKKSGWGRRIISNRAGHGNFWQEIFFQLFQNDSHSIWENFNASFSGYN